MIRLGRIGGIALSVALMVGACGDDTPTPSITAVEPIQMCAGGSALTVTGEGFCDDSVVSIAQGDTSQELETTYVSETTLSATVPAGLAVGSYDVTVSNSGDKTSTLSASLEIVADPLVFFADPFTIYSGINLQVTLYAAGILGNVEEVTIFPVGDETNTTTLEVTSADGERIQALVPAGLAVGTYGVTVSDGQGCAGTLTPAFEVVEQTTIPLDRVELPFGWTDGRTGVNIYAAEELGEGEVSFAPTPRFYLNPSEAGAGTQASELAHTAWVSATRATAVVPSGLPAGTYDLIAVNPDGAVGLLESAFEVTALAPPTISELLPASVVNQETQQITILGENFRNPAFSALCRQPDDSEIALAGDILDSDASSIRVEFDFVDQVIQDGSICIVKVTNDDETYATFSALGVTNPSLNLETFSPTSALQTPRRALCAVAGEAAPGARFVYAMGGDDGTGQETTAANYYEDIEFAAVDAYGELASWASLGSTLPAPRSFHSCATVDRFVFVVGGTDGAAAQSSVWRAQILDPAEAPVIDGVNLAVDASADAGLDAGRYSYRISAIFGADDAVNPGGESLASDPLLVQLPEIDEQVTVTLSWSEVARATGYRIYRTPSPGLASGEELLLAEVAASPRTFDDDGSSTPSGRSPLPLGALGEFAILPSLTTPREGAAIAVAEDPSDSDIRYIYMLGGRDDSQTGLNTVEWLSTERGAGGAQTIGASWTAGTANIGEARWQLAAYVANDRTAPDLVAAGESWIYAAGGILDDRSFMSPDVVALKVAAGGALGEASGERYVVDEMQPYKAGYASAIFNNQLFAFGGTQGTSSTECASVEMCGLVGGACTQEIPDPPDLANWNNIGIDVTPARYLPAGVTVGAFIFVIGGVDDGAPAEAIADVAKTLW